MSWLFNPITALQNISAFRRDALAFFNAMGLYPEGVTRIDFGVKAAWVVGLPELAVAILTSDAFDKGRESYGPLGTFAGFGSLRWLVGPTLPVLENPEGLPRRRLLAPVYSRIFEACNARAAARPMRFPALPPGEHDLYPVFSDAIFGRFCEVMFGRRYDEHSAAVSNAVSTATTHLDILSKSFQPYATRTGPSASVLRECRGVLLDFSRVALADLRAGPPPGPPPALLPLLDAGLDEEQLLDEILTQIVAGTETTTITACWAAVLLTRHRDVLEALRTLPETEGRALAALVVKETTRLYPAFWTLIRVANRDVSLVGRDFLEGDLFFVSPFCVHHNPAIWPEPERFDPQRFVERAGVKGDFMPFGYGARACIGGRLAAGILNECVYEAARQLSLRFREGEPEGPEADPLIVVLKSRTGFHFRADTDPTG